MNTRRILKIVIGVWVSAVLMLVGVTPVSAAPPANDNFSNATLIAELPFSDVVDNTEATLETDEPEYCYRRRTIWYSITPEFDGAIEADTSGSDFGDTSLSAYQGAGDGFGGLQWLGCAMYGEPLYFSVHAGMTYYLQAGSVLWGGSEGYGNLHVNLRRAAPPMNDNFSNAVAITELPFSDSVDNTEATLEYGEPQGWCYNIQRTVWYSISPEADGVMRADAVGVNFYDTDLNVYRLLGSDPGFGNLEHMSCASWGGSVAFYVQAGTTYYLQAGSIWSGGELHVNLQLVPPPKNDDFANAALVSDLPFGDTVDTTAAGLEADEPGPSCVYEVIATVWYAFTPAESGPISARASADFYTELAAYTRPSLDALSLVGCRARGDLLTFRAEAGTTYYFRAGGEGSSGFGLVEFTLDVAPPPVAGFDFSPYDPSVFDPIFFWDTSWDPGGASIQTQVWDFGDGTTAEGPSPTHQYAADGDYTVGLTITTEDGRTASTSREVQVRTHDVAIVRLLAPQAARVGQTRQIAVEVSNRQYPENVEVQLLKSAPGGYQGVGTATQVVPVRGGNRTTRFSFSYTFTSEDASLGKVTFKAVATILNARDALPADNEAISSPTKVSRR